MIHTNKYIIIYCVLLNLVKNEKCFKTVCELSIICDNINAETLIINCTSKEKILFIHFEGNKLQKLHHEMFEGLTSLKQLHANENNISYIDKNTFTNLKQMTYLQLNGNSLQSINESTFGTLEKLAKLYLKYNRIRDIKRGSFNGLNALRILTVDDNIIERISSDAFSETSGLERFSCRNNSIADVSFLKNLKTVVDLDISNNNIEEIRTDILFNYTNLSQLCCNGNKIRNVSFLQYLVNLNFLNLNNNLITIVPVDIFNKLKSLTRLFMSFNKIEKIKSGTFSELKKLVYLDLSHNNLIKFGTVYLESIQNVHLENNKLSKIGIRSGVSLQLFVDNNMWDCNFLDKLFLVQKVHLKYTNNTNDTHFNGLPCEDDFDPSASVTDTNQNVQINYLLILFGVLFVSIFVVIVGICLKMRKKNNQRLHGSIASTTINRSHYEGPLENIYDVPNERYTTFSEVPNERYTTCSEGSRYLTPTLLSPHEYMEIDTKDSVNTHCHSS